MLFRSRSPVPSSPPGGQPPPGSQGGGLHPNSGSPLFRRRFHPQAQDVLSAGGRLGPIPTGDPLPRTPRRGTTRPVPGDLAGLPPDRLPSQETPVLGPGQPRVSRPKAQHPPQTPRSRVRAPVVPPPLPGTCWAEGMRGAALGGPSAGAAGVEPVSSATSSLRPASSWVRVPGPPWPSSQPGGRRPGSRCPGPSSPENRSEGAASLPASGGADGTGPVVTAPRLCPLTSSPRLPAGPVCPPLPRTVTGLEPLTLITSAKTLHERPHPEVPDGRALGGYCSAQGRGTTGALTPAPWAPLLSHSGVRDPREPWHLIQLWELLWICPKGPP